MIQKIYVNFTNYFRLNIIKQPQLSGHIKISNELWLELYACQIGFAAVSMLLMQSEDCNVNFILRKYNKLYKKVKKTCETIDSNSSYEIRLYSIELPPGTQKLPQS